MKIKAATLIESLVAMVVITLVFALALGLWVRLQTSSDLRRQQIASQRMEWLAFELEQQGWYKDDEIEYEDMVIEVRVSEHPDLEPIQKIELIAKAQEVVILNRIHLVAKPPSK